MFHAHPVEIIPSHRENGVGKSLSCRGAIEFKGSSFILRDTFALEQCQRFIVELIGVHGGEKGSLYRT